MENIKPQTGAAYGVRQQSGLGLRPIGCTPDLSVAQKRRCRCSIQLVALYKCYMHLPVPWRLVMHTYLYEFLLSLNGSKSGIIVTLWFRDTSPAVRRHK